MRRDLDPNDPTNRARDHQFVGDRFVEFCARAERYSFEEGEKIESLVTGEGVLFTASTRVHKERAFGLPRYLRTYWSPKPDMVNFSPLARLQYTDYEKYLQLTIYSEETLLTNAGSTNRLYWIPPESRFGPMFSGNVSNEYGAIEFHSTSDEGRVDSATFHLSPLGRAYDDEFTSYKLERKQYSSDPTRFGEPRHYRALAESTTGYKGSFTQTGDLIEVVLTYFGEEHLKGRLPTKFDIREIVEGIVPSRLLRDMLTDDLKLDERWKDAEIAQLLDIQILTKDTRSQAALDKAVKEMEKDNRNDSDDLPYPDPYADR